MAFDIQTFISRLGVGSIAKTSNYECLVSFPSVKQTGQEQDLIFRISKATLPARNVETYDSIIYGTAVPIAYGSLISEGSLTVILSEDLKEKEFFENCIDAAVGSYRTDDSAQQFDIGFLNDYAGTIEIYVYNDIGNKTYTAKFMGVVITSISQIEVDWSSGEEIMRLDVSFKCSKYQENRGS